MEDTQKELERLEKELLEEQPQEDGVDVILDDELLWEIIAEGATPAFEDPETIHEPAEPMVYCNYSNDYGKDLQAEPKDLEEETAAKKKRSDKLIIGLMIAASALCVGIMGILIYWWEAFLG